LELASQRPAREGDMLKKSGGIFVSIRRTVAEVATPIKPKLGPAPCSGYQIP